MGVACTAVVANRKLQFLHVVGIHSQDVVRSCVGHDAVAVCHKPRALAYCQFLVRRTNCHVGQQCKAFLKFVVDSVAVLLHRLVFDGIEHAVIGKAVAVGFDYRRGNHVQYTLLSVGRIAFLFDGYLDTLTAFTGSKLGRINRYVPFVFAVDVYPGN